MYYLGIDIGSSSIKIALVNQKNGSTKVLVQEPKHEMSIYAGHHGWAEQNPLDWWLHICNGIKRIKSAHSVSKDDILGIGISYQMHGLVIVDKAGNCLRNSIIWCDSRAVDIGNTAYATLGNEFCDTHLLNSPANFTASKLAWVRENEPELFDKIHKLMLPGDYIAMKFSEEINTTASGLSEGIFWDFKSGGISKEILEYFGFHENLLPDVVGTFSEQAFVSKKGAKESGLKKGTPILYRAGDQPNNALSLNVFNPGEVAATGGTSGVMYAVTDNLSVRECARVNNFAHVNHDDSNIRIGKLLCINGAGIQYRWLLNNLAVGSYEEMNRLASDIQIGSDGVYLIPFGNGAERMLLNEEIGTRIVNVNLNRHTKAHMCRAALEGIAFSFIYGFEIMKNDGVQPTVIRAGNDNLFRSEIFGNTISSLIQKEIEIYNTTGAIGAARACTLKNGDFKTFSSFLKKDYVKTFKPKKDNSKYIEAYNGWKNELELITNK